MLVSGVCSVSFYNNNVVPASEGATRVKQFNPAFGYLYPQWAKSIIDKHLPARRRQLFGFKILNAASAPNPKRATDWLMTKALGVAIVNMVASSLKQAIHHLCN